jgi:autotransporter-associated beta strand protein
MGCETARAGRRRLPAVALCGIFLAAMSSPANALNRGQQWFVDNGLQIMGVIGNPSRGVPFHLNTYQNMGYTTELWEWATDPAQLTMSWGRWVGDSSQMPPIGGESSYMGNLRHLGLGDEPDLNNQAIRDQFVAWYNLAHADPTFNNVLLWNNNYGGQVNDAALGDFIARAQPDMISFDTYPYAPSSQPAGGSPTNWYGDFRRYRQWGMDTNTPVGVYRQTYASPGGAPQTRAVSQSELSLQTFTSLAFNAKSLEDFTYNFSGQTLFDEAAGGDNSITALGTAAQAMNAEAKRLGPALVRLKPVADPTLPNWTSSMMFIRGKNTNSSTYNPIPIGFVQDPQSAAYTDWTQGQNDPYLTSFTTATNLGSKNLGLPGDIIVSWFRVMDETMDGTWANEKYFMVTNALADMTATPAETRQSLSLDFNFGASGITQLQRLSRATGLVEDVNLTSLGGTSYRLSLTLDGGRGDLFKFKDGAPFVGISAPPGTLRYWDNDANAGNNNLGTGAGLGGTGTWNTSSLKWYDGVSDVAWTSGGDAVFWGAAGTVTLGAAQSAKNLTFKTNGYTVTGSTLTLIGDPAFSTITVDSGVTANIGSTVAGTAALIKTGSGTLNFTAANTYSGGTTISGGVLGIVSGSLGPIPGTPTLNIWIEQGATLRFNVNNLTLPTQRLITLGTGGGVFDTNGNTDTIAGVISGTTLTKNGAGTLVLTGANDYAGGTTVHAGALRVNADSGLGAVPGSPAANITLNGGTLQWGATFDINNNRAFTFGASGGTLDTNGFGTSVGYGPVNGFRGAGNLTKTGLGTFYTGGAGNTWTGNLIIKQGIFKTYNEGGLQAAPAAVQAGAVTLDGGTFQINSSFGPTHVNRGMTMAAGGGTIDTQNYNLTWGGPVAGAGSLTKIGSGILRFQGTGTNTGAININAGTLQVAGGAAIGNTSAVSLANTAGVVLDVTASETIGSLAGAGATGGNVTLGANSLTAGGNNSSTTYAGVISGTGGLTKAGTGTMTLTGANTYSGGTTISGGTLQIGAGGTVGSITGNVTDNAALTFNRSDTVAFGGVVSGTGSLTKLGTGTLDLTGTNTYTGGTNINAGTLKISAGGLSGSGPISLPSGGTLTRTGGIFNFTTLNQTGGTFNHSLANHLLVASSGGATYTLNTGDLTTHASYGLWVGATGSYTSGNGTLTQSGGTLSTNRLEIGRNSGLTGTVNLSGTGSVSAANVYVGGTTAAGAGTGVLNISGGSMTLSGWLRVWNTGAAAPGGTRVNLSGGTLSVYGLNTSGNPARWNWTGGTFNLGAGGWVQSPPFPPDDGGGESSFTIGNDGPMGESLDLWTGKNFVLHRTNLIVDPVGSLAVTGGELSAATGMHNDGTFTQTAGLASLGPITGTGSMTLSGGTLSAASVRQRSLHIDGDAVATIVKSGGAGEASYLEDLSLTGESILDLTDNALIVTSGNLAAITSLIAAGRNHGMWDGNGITSSAAAAELSTGLAVTQADNDSVVVTYTWNGDIDVNGTVDRTDAAIFAQNVGQLGSTWSTGDFDYDGATTLADFTLLQANLGKSVAPSLTTTSAVPEPSTVSLMILAVSILGCHARVRAGMRQRTFRP